MSAFNFNVSLKGEYVVGVISEEDDINYFLNVNFETKYIVSALSGIPYQIRVEPQKFYYLEYYHYLNESFSIIAYR